MSVLKRYAGLTLGLFLIFAAPFAGLIMLFGANSCNSTEELVLGALQIGGFVGALAVAFIIPLLVISELLGAKLNSLTIEQSHQFKLHTDLATAHRMCLESLKGLGRSFELLKDDIRSGEIVARTGITWKSFGERITFKLNSGQGSPIDVEVVSRPALFTTSQDWGVNAANIETIAGTLSRFEPA